MSPQRGWFWLSLVACAALLALIGLRALPAAIYDSLDKMQASSCNSPRTPAERMACGRIYATDLPFGWHGRNEKPWPVTDGQGILVSYFGGSDSQPWVSVGQRLALYPSAERCIEAYNAEAATLTATIESKGNAWWHWADLGVGGHADQVMSICGSVTISGDPVESCIVVARYGDMLTWLNGNIGSGSFITMPQLQHLLERMDARMESARLREQSSATQTATSASPD